MFLRCKRCVTPNTRPRLVFDAQGICQACLYADEKKKIDWDQRRAEFELLVKEIKAERTSDTVYDCIVPWSGGKDSSTVAYKLKYEWELNPLLVTYAPMLPNELGHKNRLELLKAGFDSLMFSANQDVLRRLAKRFFVERGNPKVAWDAGINVVPVRVAQNFGIKNIFYAEHGETEYGGRILSRDHQKRRDLAEVLENYIGDDPLNWVDDQTSTADVYPYLYPDESSVKNDRIVAHYFGYYHRWSILENYHYISEKISFSVHPRGRCNGTFTSYDSLDDKLDPLYYYMQLVKFGFGRATRDASRLIQNDQMSREEALELVKKFDFEFCYEDFDEVRDYLELTDSQFWNIVDTHRDRDIWYFDNGEWKVIEH